MQLNSSLQQPLPNAVLDLVAMSTVPTAGNSDQLLMASTGVDDGKSVIFERVVFGDGLAVKSKCVGHIQSSLVVQPVADLDTAATASINSKLSLAVISEDVAVAATEHGFLLLGIGGGKLVLLNQTDLNVPSSSKLTWQLLAAGFGGGSTAASLFAAIRTPAATDDQPVSAEVWLFEVSKQPQPQSQPEYKYRTHTLVDVSSSRIVSAHIADIYGDGAPMLLLIHEDSTVDVLWLSTGTSLLSHVARWINVEI
jgi:hypothetical protein